MIDSIEILTINDNIVLITIEVQNVISKLNEEKLSKFAKEIDLAMLKLYAIKISNNVLTVKATSPLDLAPTWEMAQTLLNLVKKDLIEAELPSDQLLIF